MIVGRKRALVSRLLQQLVVLRTGLSFQRFGRDESCHRRCFADLNAFFDGLGFG